MILGIPVLLQQVNINEDDRHVKAAVALARLGQEEGYKVLETALKGDPHTRAQAIRGLLEIRSATAIRLLINKSRDKPQAEAYRVILNGLRHDFPKQVAPVILEHLLELLSQSPDSIREIEADVNILAPIVRIVPPLDVTDKKKMNSFIKEIEVWNKLNRDDRL